MAAETQNSLTRLDKYHMTLAIGKYVRPKTFVRAEWEPMKTIIFPLPLTLFDSTSVNYDNVNLEIVGDALNNQFAGALASYGLRETGNVLSGAISGFASGISRGMAGENAGGLVQKMVDTAFPADKVTSALQQSVGMAPNPNPSVAFSGPELRSFTLSWYFTPKNKTESDNLNKVIKFLKSSALPTTTIERTTAILEYPHLCQLNFYPWDKGGASNEWGWTDNSIIRIKKCFMTSVNVNYNASSIPAFFNDGNSPVSIQIEIQFQEIEYMLSKDWAGEDVIGKMSGADFTGELIGGAARLLPGGDTALDFLNGVL